MSNVLKIEVTEAEWEAADDQVKRRIVELMQEYGYAPGMLGDFLTADPAQDVFQQFYGDEEDEA